MRRAARLVSALALPCLAAAALAQPANDERSGAIVLLPGTPVIADCATATTAPDDPLLACRTNAGCVEASPTQGAGSVWFTFYSTGDDFTLTTTDPASDGEGDTILTLFVRRLYDTEFAVYRCNDDIDCQNGVLTSHLDIRSALPGDQFLVQVAAWSSAAQRPYLLTLESDINADEPATAPTMSCDAAYEIMAFTSLTASPGDPPAPCVSEPPTGPTFWSRFVAEDRVYAIHVVPFFTPAAEEDTVMTVFLEHPDGTLEPVACNDDATAATRLSRVVLATPIVGATYLVQVALKDAPLQNPPYRLWLECALPPPLGPPTACRVPSTAELEVCGERANDDCATANLQTISIGETICGESARFTPSTTDVDFYRLLVTRPTWVELRSESTASIAFELRTSCGSFTPLPSSTVGTFDSRRLDPGLYLLRLSRTAPTSCVNARYNFSITYAVGGGDADADGRVTFADISVVLANFGNNYRPIPGTGLGDADRNGIVTFFDVQAVLNALRSPPPAGL